MRNKKVAVAMLALALLGVPSLSRAACQTCKHIFFVGWRCAFAETTGKVYCEDRFGPCRLWGANCSRPGVGGGEDEIIVQDVGAPVCRVPVPQESLPVLAPPLREGEERE
jgi:hypothetical protein